MRTDQRRFEPQLAEGQCRGLGVVGPVRGGRLAFLELGEAKLPIEGPPHEAVVQVEKLLIHGGARAE